MYEYYNLKNDVSKLVINFAEKYVFSIKQNYQETMRFGIKIIEKENTYDIYEFITYIYL